MQEGYDKQEADREKLLREARRLVVKVGTNTVTDASGDLCAERVAPIVHSIAELMKAGRQVVLVSSGAVGLGRGWLGLHRSRLDDLATKQACAAVGQNLLMDAYKNLFSRWEVKIAQVLLTEEDFTNWSRYSSLRRTIDKLLGFGVLPIVNENDTVSTAELEAVTQGSRTPIFSDNDRLAGLVMSGMEADALVLLTNVDGLMGPGAAGKAGAPPSEVIPLVTELTGELKALGAGPSENGRGGMRTKLEAAEIAMNCGGAAVIANGKIGDALKRIFAGEKIGTTFLPLRRMRGKRRWIAYAAHARGRVMVDPGAQRAVTQGKASLLASGVVRVENAFASMDVVSIVDTEGREFARGIANCASDVAEKASSEKRATKRGTRTARGTTPSLILMRRDNIVVLEPS